MVIKNLPMSGFNHYKVSDCGAVYSGYTGKELRGYVSRGYQWVDLIHSSLGRAGRIVVGVHRLVAWTFIGPQPPGIQVRHLDDNGMNNCVTNLAYGTAQDNSNDKYRNGNGQEGEAHSQAKLTYEKVAEIRSYDPSVSHRTIANWYGVSDSTISLIRRNKIWRNER